PFAFAVDSQDDLDRPFKTEMESFPDVNTAYLKACKGDFEEINTVDAAVYKETIERKLFEIFTHQPRQQLKTEDQPTLQYLRTSCTEMIAKTVQNVAENFIFMPPRSQFAVVAEIAKLKTNTFNIHQLQESYFLTFQQPQGLPDKEFIAKAGRAIKTLQPENCGAYEYDKVRAEVSAFLEAIRAPFSKRTRHLFPIWVHGLPGLGQVEWVTKLCAVLKDPFEPLDGPSEVLKGPHCFDVSASLDDQSNMLSNLQKLLRILLQKKYGAGVLRINKIDWKALDAYDIGNALSHQKFLPFGSMRIALRPMLVVFLDTDVSNDDGVMCCFTELKLKPLDQSQCEAFIDNNLDRDKIASAQDANKEITFLKQHVVLEKINDYKSLERLLQSSYVVWSDEESLIGRWSDPQKEARERTKELQECRAELAELKLQSLNLEEKIAELVRESKDKEGHSRHTRELSYYT
ncbi:MAG: hypothetical protein ACPG7U_04590, partial [Holosporaceae bacterium]